MMRAVLVVASLVLLVWSVMPAVRFFLEHPTPSSTSRYSRLLVTKGPCYELPDAEINGCLAKAWRERR